MSLKPAIVIVAYNRPKAFWRLLKSIERAIYSGTDINLVISIDKSEVNEVFQLANQFEWKHGNKVIIKHDEHLGLKEHILRCGDLTRKYGSVIILEDDLMVSPWFYHYAVLALNFYKEEKALAGISLYNYQVAESCFYPFKAIDDGTDVYFMQVVSSWGQAWNVNQWNDFRTWLVNNPELANSPAIPRYIHQWGKHSWKKHFINYLIEADKYFVFPRFSLTTNFEEPGTNALTKGVFQVSLQTAYKEVLFSSFEQSLSVYDAWFEIKVCCLNKLLPDLKKYNYEVDLYSAKEIKNIGKEHLLSSKQITDAVFSYGSELFPLETNVLLNNPGSKINFGKAKDFNEETNNLGIKNLLRESEKDSKLRITAILPIINPKEDELKRTLNSFEMQNYPDKVLIIVASEQHLPEIEKICSYCVERITLIWVGSGSGMSLYLSEGIKLVNKDVVTIISQGSVFSKDCFTKVAAIFKNFISVAWIRGVKEHYNNKEQYDKLRTFNYRLTPSEAYNRLEKNKVDLSLELNFIRIACFNKFKYRTSSVEELFFNLLCDFQLTIVVNCFGKTEGNPESGLDIGLKEKLLSDYKHLTKQTRLGSRIIEYLIRLPFLNDGSWQWYYTSLNNFPDVLRYDELNNTFYFNKF